MELHIESKEECSKIKAEKRCVEGTKDWTMKDEDDKIILH